MTPSKNTTSHNTETTPGNVSTPATIATAMDTPNTICSAMVDTTNLLWFADYIGPYTFRSLQGSPPALMQQLLVVARPGVRGVAFWKQGVRGQQFTLRSLAGVASVGYGRWLYSEYTTLTDDDPVEVQWYGCALWGMEWLKVQVLDVQIVSLQQCLLDTGGAGALLECDWRLHTVEIDPD